MLSAREWANLTGEPHIVYDRNAINVEQWPQSQVAGVSQVGDAGNQGFGVAFAQVTEFNGRVHQLDNDIQAFHSPDATSEADMNHAAALALQELSLKMRWNAFVPTWNTWMANHESSFSRLPGSAAIEFAAIQTQYNDFLAEFTSLGGHSSAKPAITEDQPQPSAVDKLLAFLDSAKWIIGLGLLAYVLVGTGAVGAAAVALGAKGR